MNHLNEKNGIMGRDVEAQIAVSMYNGPPDCRHFYGEPLNPPVVMLDWHGELQHTLTTTGLASSAAKYKLAAEDIAKQIFEALSKELKERREKEGVMPELPAAFYPAYRQPPPLPFSAYGTLETVVSGHGLMNHNETLWRLEADRSPADVLAEVQHRLESAGWKGSIATVMRECPHLRMTKGAAVLTAYVPSPNGSPANAGLKPQTLNIHFVDRMTEKELHAAIDQAMAADVSADVLACFEQVWSREQSERLLKRLSSKPARTPQASLTLANLYHRFGQDDKSRSELLRTRAPWRTRCSTMPTSIAAFRNWPRVSRTRN